MLIATTKITLHEIEGIEQERERDIGGEAETEIYKERDRETNTERRKEA